MESPTTATLSGGGPLGAPAAGVDEDEFGGAGAGPAGGAPSTASPPGAPDQGWTTVEDDDAGAGVVASGRDRETPDPCAVAVDVDVVASSVDVEAPEEVATTGGGGAGPMGPAPSSAPLGAGAPVVTTSNPASRPTVALAHPTTPIRPGIRPARTGRSIRMYDAVASAKVTATRTPSKGNGSSPVVRWVIQRNTGQW